MNPKKSLGQHFLIRDGVIHRILRALELKTTDQVLEIGPGRGALTLPLAAQAERLLLVEKDAALAAWLGEKLVDRPVEVLTGDFLDLEWSELEARLRPGFKIVSNLPYNVGTAILTKSLRAAAPGTEMVLMFQKEVGERVTAKPRSKDYGSLSIFCQLLAEVRVICVVPPAAFRPPPKVESLVIQFCKRKSPLLAPRDWEEFESLVQAGFKQRRKMLRQNLRAAFGNETAGEIEERLAAQGANPQARAEELSLEQWVGLFKARSGKPRG